MAFFLLFFTLDLAFLFLAISFIKQGPEGQVNHELTIAGGVFGLLAAFLAWYNALAGIADTSNRYVHHRCMFRWDPCAGRPLHHVVQHTVHEPCLFSIRNVRSLTPGFPSFFIIPVAHFPWSEKGRRRRDIETDKDHTA